MGFILSAFASFFLMQLTDAIVKSNPWRQGGDHMQKIEASAQLVIDKCKLDKMQGRIKTFAESVVCSNPALRTAFQKEGFPHLDKVDEFLAKRVECARKLDEKPGDDSEAHSCAEGALAELIKSARSQ